MTPTNKLRFVERKDFTDDLANPVILRVLQQWWSVDDIQEFSKLLILGEWKDVPLEEEE